MQFNANGIGNKLGEFLERHSVKVTVIQESNLSSNSRTPDILNFTVRKARRHDQGGGLLTLIHKSTNFSRRPESPDTLAVGNSFGGVDHYQHLLGILYWNLWMYVCFIKSDLFSRTT